MRHSPVLFGFGVSLVIQAPLIVIVAMHQPHRALLLAGMWLLLLLLAVVYATAYRRRNLRGHQPRNPRGGGLARRPWPPGR